MSNMDFPMALDVLCVSDRQFDLMIEHEFGKAFMRLSIYFSLNYNVNTGAIHRKRVSEIAARARVNLGDVYAFKAFAKKIGFADFRISNMKLTGRLKHTPKVRWSEEDNEIIEVNRMKVAMIHRDGVRGLMDNNVPGSQLRLAIATAFHVDNATGTLHDKHPDTWARLIGHFRTTVTRGLERLNEIGFLQTETDYLVSGRLPWTAYACGWFTQRRIAQARLERGDGELGVKLKFIQAQKWLREGYGFCTEFLNNPSKVMDAAKALGWESVKKEEDESSTTQSVGYHLRENGSKRWTDPSAFADAVEALAKEDAGAGI
ncbi:hypothetical protein F4Y93_06185 [Candidatus Poribacteria bacterium]|nr:hypothetical protein [Candidatus Poribacteria bacterium]